jgi:hypothetical protein
MKKIILLLFIPLVSFSQTYDDIMSIDSKEQFIRVMVENGFEMIKSNDTELVYALDPNSDGTSSSFANYLIGDNGDSVMFQYTTTDFFGNNNKGNQYDKVYKVAKSKCEYDEIIDSIVEGSKAQMVKYKCGSKRIAFQKEDGKGYIFYINPVM